MKSRNVSRRPSSQIQKRRSFLETASKSRRNPFRGRLLRVEQLEDRRLLAVMFSENWDGVGAPALPAGWATSNSGVSGINWVTDAAASSSAPNSAFVPDLGNIGDNLLDSPTFFVFNNPTAQLPQLTFQNNFILEDTFDGGVLEISINGGAFADILAAGGSFVTGGYTETIDSSFGSPISGRQAWSGDSGGFITTTVDLPASTLGSNVQFRFREGTDSSFSDVGWRLDDLVLTVSNDALVNGTAGNDSLVVTATGANSGSFVLNGGPAIPFSGISSLTFNALGGDDAMTINFAGGTLSSVALNYNGGGNPGDNLVLQGGVWTTNTYNYTNASDGDINLDGSIITYTGLAPILNTGTAVNAIFNFPSGNGDDLVELIGNGIAGDNLSRLQSTAGVPTFETTDFASPTATLTINLGDDGETYTQSTMTDLTTPNLIINGGTAADTINVRFSNGPLAAAFTNTTTINAGGGLDNVNIGSTGNLISTISGPVFVNGDALGANVTVNAQGAAVAADYTITNTTITRSTPAGFGGLTYGGLVPTNLVTLNTGSGANIFTVTSTANVITTVNSGGGDDTFNVTGSGLLGTNNFNGEAGDDVFNVAAPIAGAAIVNVDGGPHVVGDSLNLNAGGADVVQNGNDQFVIGGPLNYVNIETVLLTNLNSLTVNGDDGALIHNQLVLTRTQANRFRSLLDGGPAILFDRPLTVVAAAFLFNGQTGDDTLTVDNGAFSDLVNLLVRFNGGTNSPVGTEASGPPGDTLVITGQETDGGIVARETYLVGPTQDAGTWILDRDGNTGPGATFAPNGDELTVSFTGLEPVDTDTPAAIFDVIYTGAADLATIENGGALPGGTSLRVVDNSATFETFRFANKTAARLMGSNGSDAFRLNATINAAGLTTLQLFGNVAGDVGVPADDDSSDNFEINNTTAATTALFGQGGSDLFHNAGFGPFFSGIRDLTGVIGTLNINGGTSAGDADAVVLLDDNAAAADAATLTLSQLTGAATGTIGYNLVESFFFEATTFADTIDVLSTAAGTAYELSGDGESDVVTIGNQTADFNANTFDGSLDAILGPVIVGADRNGTDGAADRLNIDDSGTAALAGAASITNIGPTTFNINTIAAYILDSDTGATTRLANFAPANIDYFHDAINGNLSRLEFLNVRTSTGNDVVNVIHTTAVTQTTLDTRQGNDTVTITGDNLSADNLFRGLGAPSVADGNDFFTLNIAANLGAGAFVPLTSVRIEGNNQLAGVDGRDRVLINDNNAGFARNLNYHYLTAGSGDIDIEAVGGAGLAGGVVPALAVNVRTMESVTFLAAGANNDTVRVTGIVANDDILTVVPDAVGNGRALVYRDGAPYLGAPPPTIANARPGVSGGSAGPDLAIAGMVPAGITVDGGGNSGAATSGDRAVVHAVSENALNNGGAAPIFSGGFTLYGAALGAGIIQPSVAAGAAFDNVSVTDSLVSIFNTGALGALLPVNIATATFVQNAPTPPPTQRAGVIANGGDEAGVRTVGPLAGIAADDFTVTVSTNFNLKVNGNLPDPFALGTDGLPIGDRLVLSGPGSLNIFSDKAVPPNVSIQYSGNVFNVQYSSIERVEASPGNGTLNLIGDNNNPSAANNQPDNFVVRGRNVDLDFVDQGRQEMTVAINGSAPILVNSVQFLKAYGDDLQGTFSPANINTNDNSVDTLDIRGYADYTSRGWGVDAFFNEGAPAQTDGLQADLIIYHTSTGVAAPPDVFGAGTISEDIIVQPTGPDNGEIRSTNAVDGTLVYNLAYVANTDIIFVDDDGVPGNGVPPGPPPPAGTIFDALSDVDSLTLRGTDPNNGGTSGNERFDINITAALGTPALPAITVTDTASGLILYRVREFRTQTQVAGVTDSSDFLARDTAGALTYTTIKLDPLGGDDVVQVNDPATGAADGTSVLMPVSLNVGAGNDIVDLTRIAAGMPATQTTQIYGGEGSDLLIGTQYFDRIYGGAGNDTIVGLGGVDHEYGEDGNDRFGDLLLTGNGVADDGGSDAMFGGDGIDQFIWEPGDGSDVIQGGVDGADILRFFGDAGANAFFLIPAAAAPTHMNTILGAATVDTHGVEQIIVDGRTGADTFTVSDLTPTEVADLVLVVDSAAGSADAVDITSRNVADDVAITVVGGTRVNIAGLEYDINIDGVALADADTLTFNAHRGNDNVLTTDSLSLLFSSAEVIINGGDGNDFVSGFGTLNGDAGDDTLLGSLDGQTINGGAGNDTIRGAGGIDVVSGDAGDDTFLLDFDGNVDNYFGGDGYDTLVVSGTPGNDVITSNQLDATIQLRNTLNGVSETDFLQTAAGVRTLERVRIEAGTGDDTVVVTHADVLGVDGLVNSVLFDIDGGPANTRDRLSVQDNGTGDLVLYRQGTTSDSGSISVGPGNAEPLETVFTGFERVDPIAAAGGAVRFFKLDTLEWNDDIANASYLGADETINVDPNIDPGLVSVPGFADLPADNDFYRIVAERTGTLDIQVYFSVLGTVPSGRPALPNAGNLDIELYDVDGTLIVDSVAGGVVPEFGLNDATDNERIRIPAVAGQTYYLRVLPNGTAINTYSITTVNTAAPVPFDIELLDNPVNTTTNSTAGAPGATAAGVSSDTGRSQLDNITFDNDPTILIRVPNVIQVGGLSFIDDIPANGNGVTPGSPPDETILIPFVTSTLLNSPLPGFRVAVFVTENNTTDAVLAGYAQPIAGRPGVFTFTFANDALVPDGSYFISSSVEMIDPALAEQNQGFGELAQSLEAVIDTTLPTAFFGTSASGTDGLHPSSDSGVANTPATFTDRVTSDTTPTFWGVAEADTVIRVYADLDASGTVTAGDVQIATTVTLPYDGTNQYPNGAWEATSFVDLNNPAFFAKDGLRTILVTAEDVAGNLVGPPTTTNLQIFIDTQGPQVTDVDINNAGNPYDLFDPKPSTDGPTPLVNSLVISLRDLPVRANPFLYGALEPIAAATLGTYQVRGDYNGIIPISSVVVINNAVIAGSFATATVQINFANPLPDDRFTLTILDEVVDPVGNRLDGESNASEPQENPTFPSGNGITGGNFVARFTVDTRPEVGTWGAGAAWIDTNGNTTFDQNNADYTNRDITYYMGYTSDNLFAGNFVRAPGGVADGFDKLAAYGKVGSSWRFLVDVDNDGAITPGVDIAVVDPAGINGVPVAGNFDGNAANGDEVGIFTGTTWYFDTNHDFKVELGSALAWSVNGYPVVGNFDGVGGDDLATYKDNVFSIDLGRNGTIDNTFRFGFPTPNNRPVSADMDQDGRDDLGLFVPNRAGVSPAEDAEWYILVSGGASLISRIHADPIDGVPVIDYTPVPFGDDIFIQYGDQFGLPILGNFDPPVTPGGSTSVSFPSSNPTNPLDVNNDGFVTPIDALLVINEINTNGSHALDTDGFHTAPFIDTDRDNVVSPHDVLLVINRLNAPPAGSPGAEGEGEDDAVASAHDSIFSDLGATAPVTSSGDNGILSLLADDQVLAKRNRHAK